MAHRQGELIRRGLSDRPFIRASDNLNKSEVTRLNLT